MALLKLINEGNFHIFVCGLTQSGKSHFTKAALLQMSTPVVYFNIQGEKVPRGFVTVFASKIEPEQFLDLIRDGVKINLVFTDVRRGYEYIAGYIINLVMEAGFDENHPVYICLEECHLLKGYSLEIANYAATAGLKKGVRLISVTQRPAVCSKTLYTQAFEHYIFYTSTADEAYLRSKGLDYGKCKENWDIMGKHSYCYFNGYTLEGRKAI